MFTRPCIIPGVPSGRVHVNCEDGPRWVKLTRRLSASLPVPPLSSPRLRGTRVRNGGKAPVSNHFFRDLVVVYAANTPHSGALAADASSNIKRVRLKTSFAARYPPCTSQRANFPRPSPSPTSVKYVDARYETFRLVAYTFLRLRRVSRERHERTREQGEGERESESAFDPFEERRLGTKGERQRRNFNSPGLFSTCTPTAVQSRPFSHPFSLSPPSLPPPVRPALSGQIDFS